MAKKLPPPTCSVPKKLNWEFNAPTGDYIAKVGPSTRLIRTGRTPKNYWYLAEYWGDYSLRFPVGTGAATPAKALKDLCVDVRKLLRRK